MSLPFVKMSLVNRVNMSNQNKTKRVNMIQKIASILRGLLERRQRGLSGESRGGKYALHWLKDRNIKHVNGNVVMNTLTVPAEGSHKGYFTVSPRKGGKVKSVSKDFCHPKYHHSFKDY